jgi:flagellar hook-basal body complex protein FliE
MAVLPIGALSQIATPAITGTKGATGTDGVDFGKAMGNAIDSLNGTQANADQLATAAATGNLSDVHDYMIAATEASLATELTVAVRNKAVEAFNQIMNMPV